MRIISGKFKSRRLLPPKGMSTRPTEDRVKESLFNILSPILNDSVVLDACAGTGNIGLEFLSRGAKEVYCCEKDRKTYEILRENIKMLKVETEVKAFNMDIIKLLDSLQSKGIIFDYIYIDPPYENIDLYDKILLKISNNNLLSKDGIVMLEHKKELSVQSMLKFDIIDERDYGSKVISFYKKGD